MYPSSSPEPEEILEEEDDEYIKLFPPGCPVRSNISTILYRVLGYILYYIVMYTSLSYLYVLRII